MEEVEEIELHEAEAAIEEMGQFACGVARSIIFDARSDGHVIVVAYSNGATGFLDKAIQKIDPPKCRCCGRNIDT